MMNQKNSIVKNLTKGIEYLFRKNGVSLINGVASLSGPNEIICSSNDGTKHQIKAKHIIIATGSKPIQFPGVDFDEKTILSSTGALEIEKVPKKMVIIGAGVIGLELGSVWSRLGSEVIFVEMLATIGSSMDTNLS